MKKILFLLICLCCFGFISAAYAQDMDDDSEDDDLYAPQQYLDDNLYSCILHPTNVSFREKSMILLNPIYGAKKVIYYGPFQQYVAFVSHNPSMVKIFSGSGVTASSIQNMTGINPYALSIQSVGLTIVIRHGFEARMRMRYNFLVYDFNYLCTHRIYGTHTGGSGRVFTFSMQSIARVEVRCRRVGSTEAWGVCH